jgi:hypothetical protein
MTGVRLVDSLVPLCDAQDTGRPAYDAAGDDGVIAFGLVRKGAQRLLVARA